jgi:hypothetical protein
MAPTTKTWTKSSYCANSTCVEIATEGDRVYLRDGKNPHEGMIEMSRGDWDQFLDRLQAGHFA